MRRYIGRSSRIQAQLGCGSDGKRLEWCERWRRKAVWKRTKLVSRGSDDSIRHSTGRLLICRREKKGSDMSCFVLGVGL